MGSSYKLNLAPLWCFCLLENNVYTNDSMKFASSQYSIQRKVLLLWMAIQSPYRSQTPVRISFQHPVIVIVRVHYGLWLLFLECITHLFLPIGTILQVTNKRALIKTMIWVFGSKNKWKVSFRTKILSIKE